MGLWCVLGPHTWHVGPQSVEANNLCKIIAISFYASEVKCEAFERVRSTARSNMEPTLDVDWCLKKPKQNMTSVLNGLYRNELTELTLQ